MGWTKLIPFKLCGNIGKKDDKRPADKKVGLLSSCKLYFKLWFSYSTRLFTDNNICIINIQESLMFREPKETVKDLLEKLQELWRYL